MKPCNKGTVPTCASYPVSHDNSGIDWGTMTSSAAVQEVLAPDRRGEIASNGEKVPSIVELDDNSRHVECEKIDPMLEFAKKFARSCG